MIIQIFHCFGSFFPYCEFQEAKDLTDQEMYKKARAYNKKFTIWKETSKTMEDLDNQLLLDKKMKEKIDNFIGMVQSDIDGRQFDISGKSFLEGVLDKDAENAKLEKEKSELIGKHTRELTAKDREKDTAVAAKDREKDAAVAQKQAELVQKQAELVQKQAELAQKQKEMLQEKAFKSLSFEKARELKEETIKLKEEIRILEENCEENIYEEVEDPLYDPNAFGQKKDKPFNPLYDPNAFGQKKDKPFNPLYDPNAFGQKKDKPFNPLYDPNAFGQ